VGNSKTAPGVLVKQHPPLLVKWHPLLNRARASKEVKEGQNDIYKIEGQKHV
jgi:hypothetical protein